MTEEIKKVSLYHMEILEEGKTETHYILRVPGGWIFTDRRGNDAVGTFIPWESMGYTEGMKYGQIYRDYINVEIQKS